MMTRKVRISLIGVAVILIAAVITIGWLFSKAAPIGTGFVAKYLCSSTFISNRNPEIVFQEDVLPVNPLAKIVDYTIDRQQKSVTLDSFGLFALTAIAPLFDAPYMLYGSYDFAGYAAAKPLETKPDGKWYYSSGTANIVARIVRQTVKNDFEYYYSFIYEELYKFYSIIASLN